MLAVPFSARSSGSTHSTTNTATFAILVKVFASRVHGGIALWTSQRKHFIHAGTSVLATFALEVLVSS